MANELGFEYELVTYKWPYWLRDQREKQRTIWGYKILFLDVLFPLDLDKVIFVDADQVLASPLRVIDADRSHGFEDISGSRPARCPVRVYADV